MKVTTDACLFGAIVSREAASRGKNVTRVLDIGTGTGLLSLMLAQKLPGIRIDAVELDIDAAKQALENVQASPWRNNIKLIQGDIRKMDELTSYSIIFSNPPFYENELRSPDEKRNSALHSRDLSFEQLAGIISTKLDDTGSFFLLLPFKRAEEMMNILKEEKLRITKRIDIRQSTRHDPFRVIVAGEKIDGDQKIISTEMAIMDESQTYTRPFVELLRDYYLHL